MTTPCYHLEGIIRAKSDDLEDFVGPLDLILQLLSINKVEIHDIQISLILEQYLDYLDEMKRMDLEIASEFITMASHLLYIKTKTLLALKDEEPLTELELLIQSLEERRLQDYYKQIKDRAAFLESRVDYERRIFIKAPEPRAAEKPEYSHSGEDLRRTMLTLTDRAERRSDPPLEAFDRIVAKEQYPVDVKAAELLQKLISKGITKFKSLFQGSKSRSEIVATFIAVLEMCRARYIQLVGSETDYTVTYLGKQREREAEDDEGQGA